MKSLEYIIFRYCFSSDICIFVFGDGYLFNLSGSIGRRWHFVWHDKYVENLCKKVTWAGPLRENIVVGCSKGNLIHPFFFLFKSNWFTFCPTISCIDETWHCFLSGNKTYFNDKALENNLTKVGPLVWSREVYPTLFDRIPWEVFPMDYT